MSVYTPAPTALYPQEEKLEQFLPSIRTGWPAYLVEGVVRVSLGLVALLLPPVLSLPMEGLIGWLLVVASITQLIRAFLNRNLPGFLPSLNASVFFLVLGVILLVYPVEGVFSLRFLLALMFLVTGLAQLVFAARFYRFQHSGGMTFCGLIALLMFILVAAGWPGETPWLYSLMVGVQLMLEGFTLSAIAMGLKALLPPTPAPVTVEAVVEGVVVSESHSQSQENDSDTSTLQNKI